MFFTYFIFFAFLIFSVSQRINSVYLEDDMLWFVPLHLEIAKNHSVIELLKNLHGYELTLADGLYFYGLNFLFGLHLQYFVLVSLFLHLANSLLLFNFLWKRIKISFDASFVASLIFLTFYGQFHAYVWPLAAHHLITLFFTFAILDLYFRVEEKIEQDGPYRKWYGWTLGLALFSSFLRLSILMVPFMIFMHLLFCTKDHKKISEKYDRWLPLFIIFSIYPVGALICGKQVVLELVFEPFYELLEGKQNLPMALAGIALCVGALFVIRSILKRMPTGPKGEWILQIIRGLPILIFLLSPQFLWAALHLFLDPLDSALSVKTLLRWQPMYFPTVEGTAIAEIILFTILFIFFVFYTLRHNRNLIVFVVWYIFLIPYLGSRPELIFSRYLIFISPLLSVMFAVFFMEFLPQRLSQQGRKKGIICFYIFFFLLLAGNVFAIKLRLFRTMLIDYHWSYDYIKIANLIKPDAARQGMKSDSLICVSGVKEIPYAQVWKKGFLSFFLFDYHSPFRQTFAYTAHWPSQRVLTETVCPDSALRYFVNNVTVLDSNKKSIEPFYQYFERGLDFLKQKDTRQAAAAFEEARRITPFLFQFLADPFMNKIFGERRILAWIAHMVNQIVLQYYDGDPKINYIDGMIQTEARDYGAVLALLAYLQFLDGREGQSKILLEDALLFVSLDEIIRAYSAAEHSWGNQRISFTEFIKRYGARAGFRQPASPGSDIEIYRGFMIHWFNNFYSAWPYEEGNFHLGKLKQKQYSQIFVADTKQKIRKAIDEAVSLKSFIRFPRRVLSLPSEIIYKDFKIVRKGEEYFIIPPAVRLSSIKESDLFRKNLFIKIRSVMEAKLIIDTLLDL